MSIRHGSQGEGIGKGAGQVSAFLLRHLGQRALAVEDGVQEGVRLYEEGLMV